MAYLITYFLSFFLTLLTYFYSFGGFAWPADFSGQKIHRLHTSQYVNRVTSNPGPATVITLFGCIIMLHIFVALLVEMKAPCSLPGDRDH